MTICEDSFVLPDSVERVLIVTSDPGLRRVLSIVLRHAGHDVVGSIDLDELKNIEAVKKFKPSLIVLEWDLVRMHSVYRLRREVFRLAKVPVIMLSDIACAAYIKRCLRMGVRGHLNKTTDIPLIPSFIKCLRYGVA